MYSLTAFQIFARLWLIFSSLRIPVCASVCFLYGKENFWRTLLYHFWWCHSRMSTVTTHFKSHIKLASFKHFTCLYQKKNTYYYALSCIVLNWQQKSIITAHTGYNFQHFVNDDISNAEATLLFKCYQWNLNALAVWYPSSISNTWTSSTLTDGKFTWSLIPFELFFAFPQSFILRQYSLLLINYCIPIKINI